MHTWLLRHELSGIDAYLARLTRRNTHSFGEPGDTFVKGTPDRGVPWCCRRPRVHGCRDRCRLRRGATCRFRPGDAAARPRQAALTALTCSQAHHEAGADPRPRVRRRAGQRRHGLPACPMRPAACGRRRSRTPRDQQANGGALPPASEGRRPQRFSLVTFRLWEPYELSWPQRFAMTDADVAALAGAPVDRDRGDGYQPWTVEPDPEPVWRVAWTILLPHPEGMDRGCITAAAPRWRAPGPPGDSSPYDPGLLLLPPGSTGGR